MARTLGRFFGRGLFDEEIDFEGEESSIVAGFTSDEREALYVERVEDACFTAMLQERFSSMITDFS